MLQGANIFLISHPGIIHLKGQIGPESSLSFMYDIELIRGQAPYLLVEMVSVEQRAGLAEVVWSRQ